MTKFLIVSALFPPNVIGGAEVSAFNLSKWLVNNGHEVAVLSAAKNEDQVGKTISDGITQYHYLFPRPYSIVNYQTALQRDKPIWHLMDHFHPGNRKIVNEVLDIVKPDFVNIHYIQGIGYNALSAIADRNIPTMFFMHDLGLACIRMSMFKNGANCVKQCSACRVSMAYKQRMINRFQKIGFCSPSRANLDSVGNYFDFSGRFTTSILNANSYPAPSEGSRILKDLRIRSGSEELILLYAGRLHVSKGIDVLIDAVKNINRKKGFNQVFLYIAGSGPDQEALMAACENSSAIKFFGQLSQQALADEMEKSDLLCVPSTWLENSPGVAIHALSIGLPVLGSDIGGIPELVQNNYNGLLIRPGDKVEWELKISEILANRDILALWRANAIKDSSKFSQNAIGMQILQAFEAIRSD